MNMDTGQGGGRVVGWWGAGVLGWWQTRNTIPANSFCSANRVLYIQYTDLFAGTGRVKPTSCSGFTTAVRAEPPGTLLHLLLGALGRLLQLPIGRQMEIEHSNILMDALKKRTTRWDFDGFVCC